MMLKNEIASIAIFKEGLNYLVPTKWQTQSQMQVQLILQQQQINQQYLKPQSQSFQSQQLCVCSHLSRDTFLLDFKEHIKQELEEKCNLLHFQSIRISPEIKSNINWTPISPMLWKHINKKLKENHGIMTFVTNQKFTDIKNIVQIQLIFCSKTRSDAFVGYFPKKTNLIAAIRQIGYELGYIQGQKSKINFIEHNPEVCFCYYELQKYTLDDAPRLLLMAFNLQRKEEDFQRDQLIDEFGQFLFSKPDNMNESNEAVMGDQNTMEDDANNDLLNEPINNHTMSTGAETPFSFALSNGFDLDRQYRVNELFGAKQPEQIQQMRQYAKTKINSHQNLIKIPESSESKYQLDLEKLAEELFEGIHKRKNHKQKEKQLQLAYE